MKLFQTVRLTSFAWRSMGLGGMGDKRFLIVVGRIPGRFTYSRGWQEDLKGIGNITASAEPAGAHRRGLNERLGTVVNGADDWTGDRSPYSYVTSAGFILVQQTTMCSNLSFTRVRGSSPMPTKPRTREAKPNKSTNRQLVSTLRLRLHHRAIYGPVGAVGSAVLDGPQRVLRS
jgi:hypothetical protein